MLGVIDLTLRRAGEQSRGADRRATWSTTDSDIEGSWQPLPAKAIALLPEGERADDWRMLYTFTELRTADQHERTPADLVSPDDGTTFYKVMKVADWPSRSPIPHYECTCVRVRE